MKKENIIFILVILLLVVFVFGVLELISLQKENSNILLGIINQTKEVCGK